MDHLSLRTSYAFSNEVFRKEARNFFFSFADRRPYTLELDDLIVPIVSHFSTEALLQFPKSYAEEKRNKFVSQIVSQIPALVEDFSVTALVASILQTGNPWDGEAFPKYSEARRNRHQVAGKSKRKARKIEAESAFRHHVLPEFKTLGHLIPLYTYKGFVDYLNSLEEDREDSRYDPILEKMPALNNYVDILTVSGFDLGRKDQISDFYDLEMIAAPFAYSSTFVTQDSWLKELVREAPQLLERNGTAFISTVKDFCDFLTNLEGQQQC